MKKTIIATGIFIAVFLLASLSFTSAIQVSASGENSYLKNNIFIPIKRAGFLGASPNGLGQVSESSSAGTYSGNISFYLKFNFQNLGNYSISDGKIRFSVYDLDLKSKPGLKEEIQVIVLRDGPSNPAIPGSFQIPNHSPIVKINETNYLSLQLENIADTSDKALNYIINLSELGDALLFDDIENDGEFSALITLSSTSSSDIPFRNTAESFSAEASLNLINASNETDDDKDDDGYNESEDCDDNNPHIFPGAVEICDGKDNNCNGIVDEGCSSALDFFLDDFSLASNLVNNTLINFHLHSLGNVNSSPVSADIYIDGNKTNSTFFEFPASGHSDKNISFNNLSVGNHTLKIVIDTLNQYNETNENNEFVFGFIVFSQNDSDAGIAPVSNLRVESKSTNFIKWVWDNPNEPDFKDVLVYFEGILVTNTTDNFYYAGNLSADTNFTIMLKTRNTFNVTNNFGVSNTAKTDALNDGDDDGDDDDEKDRDNEDEENEFGSIVLSGGHAFNETNATILGLTAKAKENTDNIGWFILILLILIVLLLIGIYLVLKQ